MKKNSMQDFSKLTDFEIDLMVEDVVNGEITSMAKQSIELEGK